MIKKLICLAFIIVSLGISSCKQADYTVYAQSFPTTRTLDWDDNPPADNVTRYNVKQNGAAVGQPTVSQFVVTFNAPGAFQLCVNAENAWGKSTDTCING